MSKFSTDYDRAMYEKTLDGADAETGSVQENGAWYGRLDEEKCIVTEDSQGFVDTETFATSDALIERWAEIERAIEAWHGMADEPDGLPETDDCLAESDAGEYMGNTIFGEGDFA